MVNADVVLSITLLKPLTLQFCIDDIIHMCLHVSCEKICHILPSVSADKKKQHIAVCRVISIECL